MKPDPALVKVARRMLKTWVREHPLASEPVLEWSGRMRVAAGKAYPTLGIIRLSILLLTDTERVAQTLAHEYAHLMAHERTGGRGLPHGKEWKEAMAALGFPAHRTHGYKPPPRTGPVWVYRCLGCGTEVARVRRLMRGRVYTHAKCGGRIDPKGRRAVL